MPREQIPIPFSARRSFARADFVPGAANEAALDFVDAWPDWPSRVAAVWGPLGSGKTHLLEIWRARAGGHVLAADGLTVDLVASLAPGSAYAIDDADKSVGGPGLFHLVNFVVHGAGWLFMSGTEAPTRWPTSVPDLHSRLTALPGAALEGPDESLIARVLLKLFADRQLKHPEALIDYLVPRLQRSFADAERIVALIDMLALQEKRNISVEIGGKALKLLEAERV